MKSEIFYLFGEKLFENNLISLIYSMQIVTQNDGIFFHHKF